ncbi:MAG: tRNA threonylcarbamoyladenosine dehydratase [Clostridia bacterium]|nr:tRNA threonylcarbamoyladenosine dehydratase [Clostridia bacterium]
MNERFSRTKLLLGTDAMEKLKNAHVCIFGVGGVGGYVCEALARSGVGSLTLVDNDTVSVSNINRQIFALSSTVGMMKTAAAKERLCDINPEIKITEHNMFYLPDVADEIDLTQFDYVVDAIDTVTAKIYLAQKCDELNIPLIASMGTGNKLDPTQFEVTDIYKTSVCPLARVMRTELKKRGVKKLKVVYSKEQPKNAVADSQNGRHAPGSSAFVPSVAGLILAAEVIKDLINPD